MCARRDRGLGGVPGQGGGGGHLEKRHCNRINIREYSISRYEVRQPIFHVFVRFRGCRGYQHMVRPVRMCQAMPCTMASHEIPQRVAIEGKVRHWHARVRHMVRRKGGHQAGARCEKRCSTL